mmetsp:Transcript_25877/g.73627  ORF Transcript_25877/g.73627 Transcript_25877/m.73627 type:complete len:1020 (+) Transcript_25877:58-3117(+)
MEALAEKKPAEDARPAPAAESKLKTCLAGVQARFCSGPRLSPETWAAAAEPVSHEAQRQVAKLLERGQLFRSNALDRTSPVALVEREISKFTGFKYCVALDSYSSSLFLALKAAGVGGGAGVLGNSLGSSAGSAVRRAGGRFIPVECTTDLGIDVSDLTHKADAFGARFLLLSHVSGRVPDITVVSEFCQRRGIRMVEDCAESLGVLMDGRHVGHHGLMCCFSAQSHTILGAGDCRGGFVATDDLGIASRIGTLAGTYDQQRQSSSQRLGGDGEGVDHNAQMSNVAAVVLLPQISTAEVRIAAAAKRHNRLRECFERTVTQDVASQIDLHIPVSSSKVRPVLNCFVFVASLGAEGGEAVVDLARERGVPLRVMHTRLRGWGQNGALVKLRAYYVGIPLGLTESKCGKAGQALAAALNQAAAKPRTEADAAVEPLVPQAASGARRDGAAMQGSMPRRPQDSSASSCAGFSVRSGVSSVAPSSRPEGPFFGAAAGPSQPTSPRTSTSNLMKVLSAAPCTSSSEHGSVRSYQRTVEGSYRGPPRSCAGTPVGTPLSTPLGSSFPTPASTPLGSLTLSSRGAANPPAWIARSPGSPTQPMHYATAVRPGRPGGYPGGPVVNVHVATSPLGKPLSPGGPAPRQVLGSASLPPGPQQAPSQWAWPTAPGAGAGAVVQVQVQAQSMSGAPVGSGIFPLGGHEAGGYSSFDNEGSVRSFASSACQGMRGPGGSAVMAGGPRPPMIADGSPALGPQQGNHQPPPQQMRVYRQQPSMPDDLRSVSSQGNSDHQQWAPPPSEGGRRRGGQPRQQHSEQSERRRAPPAEFQASSQKSGSEVAEQPAQQLTWAGRMQRLLGAAPVETEEFERSESEETLSPEEIASEGPKPLKPLPAKGGSSRGLKKYFRKASEGMSEAVSHVESEASHMKEKVLGGLHRRPSAKGSSPQEQGDNNDGHASPMRAGLPPAVALPPTVHHASYRGSGSDPAPQHPHRDAAKHLVEKMGGGGRRRRQPHARNIMPLHEHMEECD